MNRTIALFPILLLLSLCASPAAYSAAKFEIMAIPSLMDSDMDGWYKIPPNSGPSIHSASQVYKGQTFNLLVLFQGYTADKNNNLNIRYDVQIYDPEGNPTNDKGTDMLAYQGPMGNPDVILLTRQYLKITFTDKYPFGTYTIKVTAYDKISGNTSSSESPIELIPFTLPETFKSQEEANEWLMTYYKNPTPVKAISGIRFIIEPNAEWANSNLHILTFFRKILSDNPFLSGNIIKHFDAFSLEDQKKFMLISAISGDSFLIAPITNGNKDLLNEFYNNAQSTMFPDTNGEINSAVQLDILWSEFLATGRYDPVRKIVSALALSKYVGTLEKIKEGKIGATKEVEREAYYEATYSSAVWSLVSNCKQMPLVFKYCAFMYKNEPLDENIKNQLGSILHIVQTQIREEKEATGK